MLSSQGAGLPVLKYFWDLLHCTHIVLRNINQILHGDQTTLGNFFFHGQPRMLTRDLFAVANFLLTLLLYS